MTKTASMIGVIAVIIGISFASNSNAQIQNYSQNFEGLDAASASALDEDGWLVGANVFAPSGAFLYNYFGDENGPFPAPNHEFAFSQIATGAGGDNQGVQYLNVFSDYNNGDHSNGSGNLIDSLVYQNNIIGADDLNQTVTFEFDYRRADEEFGPGPNTTTFGFIRILSPAPDFFLIFEDFVETTDATMEWTENASLEFEIADDLEGFIFQFGFYSRCSNEESSGMYYDNVSFGFPADCLVGDLDGNGTINLLDVAPFVDAISSGEFSCEADVDGNGTVNLLDVNPFVLLLSGG